LIKPYNHKQIISKPQNFNLISNSYNTIS
jgi:hypothetical protein